MERTERQEKVDIIWQQLCYWEMIANTLIHREFTSSYTAKFVIEKDRLYTENANRSSGDGIITPDNMEPNPKNPIIASFFRNIGWSDRLGSGVRNIFKYSKYYSGEEPEFVEGDVFRIIVPLNEDYSYDNVKNGDKKTAIKSGDKKATIKSARQKEEIIAYLTDHISARSADIAELLGVKSTRAKKLLSELTVEEIVVAEGGNRNRTYRLKT